MSGPYAEQVFADREEGCQCEDASECDCHERGTD
jgi:hypothetical protein